MAARYNRQGIKTALAKMHDLLSWLDGLGITGGYESYPAVAYSIYLSTWEPWDNLRWGRHWGAISAVYHTSADAKASTEIISEAFALLETLALMPLPVMYVPGCPRARKYPNANRKWV